MNTLLAAALAVCLRHAQADGFEPGYERCVDVRQAFYADRKREEDAMRAREDQADHAVIDKALEEKK
jgi:hypothetical protein